MTTPTRFDELTPGDIVTEETWDGDNGDRFTIRRVYLGDGRFRVLTGNYTGEVEVEDASPWDDYDVEGTQPNTT